MINWGCTARRCWFKVGVSYGLATIKPCSSLHLAKGVGVSICPRPDFLSGVEITDARVCSEAKIASTIGTAIREDDATDICKRTYIPKPRVACGETLMTGSRPWATAEPNHSLSLISFMASLRDSPGMRSMKRIPSK